MMSSSFDPYLRRQRFEEFLRRGAQPTAAAPAEDASEKLKKLLEFNLKPRDLKQYLDRFVIRQEVWRVNRQPSI